MTLNQNHWFIDLFVLIFFIKDYTFINIYLSLIKIIKWEQLDVAIVKSSEMSINFQMKSLTLKYKTDKF